MFKTSEPNFGSGQPLLIDAKAVGGDARKIERTIWRDDLAGRIPAPVLLAAQNDGASRISGDGWLLDVRPGMPGRPVIYNPVPRHLES